MIDTVGADRVATAMGYANLAFTSGYMAGPTVGGVLYATAGHNAVFLLMIGLLVLDMVCRLLIIEKREATELRKVLGNPDGEDGDDEPSRRPLLAREPGKSFNLDINIEISLTRRVHLTNHPYSTEHLSDTAATPKREFAYETLITSKRLVISLVCAFVQAFLMASIEATLPLRLRELFDYGSAATGVIFLALLLPSVLAEVIGKIP